MLEEDVADDGLAVIFLELLDFVDLGGDELGEGLLEGGFCGGGGVETVDEGDGGSSATRV